jgi:hypothetical protein
MLRTGRAMVTSGTVMIVEPDPAIAAIWAEVAVYAGFAAEVVPDLFEETPGGAVQALVVRVSPARHRLPAGWKTDRRPRCIALPSGEPGDIDLTDFDVVLPSEQLVRALYAELNHLAASA